MSKKNGRKKKLAPLQLKCYNRNKIRLQKYNKSIYPSIPKFNNTFNIQYQKKKNQQQKNKYFSPLPNRRGNVFGNVNVIYKQPRVQLNKII